MQIIITGELKELLGQIVIESFGIRIHGERGRGGCVCWGGGGGGGSDLGKGKGFQFQTSQAMNGKTGVPGGGGAGTKTLVGCSENPVVLILMRVSLPSKLRKK